MISVRVFWEDFPGVRSLGIEKLSQTLESSGKENGKLVPRIPCGCVGR